MLDKNVLHKNPLPTRKLMELRNTKKSNNNNRNLVPSFSGLVTSGSSDFF